MGQWVTVKEACKRWNISRSTLVRRIEAGIVASTLKENRRIVYVPNNVSDDTKDDTTLIERYESEIEYLRQKLDEAEAARKRQDTIMLHMTQQSQQLLEYRETPWWKRWTQRKLKRKDLKA